MSDTSYFWGDFGQAEASAIRRRRQRSVANTQAAQLGQLRGNRNLMDIQKKYSENFQPTVASFNQRGLGGPNVQSGIKTAGLEKYAESLQRDLGNESASIQDQLNSVALDEAQSQADLEDYLAQLRLQKAMSVMQAAQNIKTFGAY
jgi:hypothetical protein